jgi:deoxycytidylate deaminase
MHSDHIFNVLAKVAEQSEPFANARVAAGLVYKNEFLAIGTNKNKSHPFQKKYSTNEDAIFLHAENCVIAQATRKYSGDIISKAALYVCRVKWTSDKRVAFEQGLAMPCKGCQRCIAAFDIRSVFFTLETRGIGCL